MITHIDKLGRIVINKQIRKALDLNAGEPLYEEVVDNKIIISKANEVDYKAKVVAAIEKLICWGEALDPDFQKEMLEILE
jgi:AbrB family looped-hinge helix DNA binding protein